MSVTVTNRRSFGPLLVPLASGASVRLSPGQTSRSLPDVEVVNNPALDSLVRQGMVEVQTVADEAGDASSQRGKASRGRSGSATGDSASTTESAGTDSNSSPAESQS